MLGNLNNAVRIRKISSSNHVSLKTSWESFSTAASQGKREYAVTVATYCTNLWKFNIFVSTLFYLKCNLKKGHILQVKTYIYLKIFSTFGLHFPSPS